MRHSAIRKVPFFGNGSNGPDTMYVVDFYEDDKQVGTAEYPGKSIYFVEAAARNWDQGILNANKAN